MPGLHRVGCRLAVVAVALITLLTVKAQAHPHVWIDLSSSLRFNDEAKIDTLVVDWLFDDFYSAFVLEDINRGGENRDEALVALARENLNNLREYGYFVDVRIDGVRQEIEDVGSFETAVRGDRLWMRFELTLPDPVDPRAHDVAYSIYDPTYYIEILHLEGDVVTLYGERSSGCLALIEPANPTVETVALAASLDKTDKAPDTLGRLFAETVEVICQN